LNAAHDSLSSSKSFALSAVAAACALHRTTRVRLERWVAVEKLLNGAGEDR
jgi:hypothetical protein